MTKVIGEQFEKFLEMFEEDYGAEKCTEKAELIFSKMLLKDEKKDREELARMFTELVKCFTYKEKEIRLETGIKLWYNWFIEHWLYSNKFITRKEEVKRRLSEKHYTDIEREKDPETYKDTGSSHGTTKSDDEKISIIDINPEGIENLKISIIGKIY